MSIPRRRINVLGPAPPFEATDTDNKFVKLSDLRGKLVVLEFGSMT